MNDLELAYLERDRSRLKIGALALTEIEKRIAEDAASGKTSPYRTALSETLEQLSCEFSKYHASQRSCRSYLSDSIRLSRFYVPDVIAELEQYKFTTGMMLACLIKSEEFPEPNVEATQTLIDWAISNSADSEAIWHRRKENEVLLSKEQSAWNKAVKSVKKYLEISAPVSGTDEHRSRCNVFLNGLEEENEYK